MLKKVALGIVLSLMVFQGTASAFDSEGEVLFRDSLYGAAIGALLGTAFYVADDSHFAEKISAGVIVGTIGGLFYGLYETRSFVEIENDKIRIAVPTPVIEKKEEGLQFSASLVRTRF